MISNREKAISNMSILKRRMRKTTPVHMSTMNLIQMLEQRLETIREMDVTFRKDEFDVLIPVPIDGGHYELLVTVSLKKVW